MKTKQVLLVAVIVLFWCQCLSQAQTKETFPLKAGAAKVDITPKGQPTTPATGKYDHERAFVRAIVLDNGTTRAAIIGLDAGLDSASWDKVSTQITSDLNCPVENIIISTTHAHSLGILRYSPEGSENFVPIVAGIAEAVRQAKAKLQPARMGFGNGTSFLNVNRDAIDPDTRKWTQAANPDGLSDKRVDVIKFETLYGEPIAVYMTYAMHPVNGYALGVFSADFPGAVCRYVEKAFDDKIIVAFSQGASGDQNPLYLRPSTNTMGSRNGRKITGYELNREDTEDPLRMFGSLKANAITPEPVDATTLDNLFRFIESEGQILGEEVIRVMTATKKMTGDVRIAAAHKIVTCPGRIRTEGSAWDPATRSGVPGVYKDGPDLNINLGVLGIGAAAIASADAEIFSYIGQRVKKESPLTNTMFVTCAFNVPSGPRKGYIPNDAAFGQLSFQVTDTNFKPGCAETSIVNGLVDMVTEYLNK